MKFSVFIATSADGFIATKDGGVDWLHSAGKKDVDMGDNADMGFQKFIDSVDCMIMGRKTMEVISSFNLPPEHWPYGDLKIIVLSNSLKEFPDNMKDKNMEFFSGEISTLVEKLEKEGYSNAYVDGGTTIQQFIQHKLVTQMTISRAPILLGEGIPLFGKTDEPISLENAEATVAPNDFIQVKYDVKY